METVNRLAAIIKDLRRSLLWLCLSIVLATAALYTVSPRLLALLQIVREMYARGISFSAIDLMQSHASRFLPAKDARAILPPFTAIKGLGIQVANGIAEARTHGRFVSVDDLARRSGANRKSLELLRACGCLDGLSENVQISLFDGL